MFLSISSTDHAEVAGTSKPTDAVQPATSAGKPSQTTAPSKATTPQDTVQISVAAQTALQELTETPVQTAQEARGGDHQAARLLAKEAAAK
jgi:hypothetical protein